MILLPLQLLPLSLLTITPLLSSTPSGSTFYPECLVEALTFFLFLFIFFGCLACGIQVTRPDIEPELLAVKAWSPNHWTTREFPISVLFYFTSHWQKFWGHLKLWKHLNWDSLVAQSVENPPATRETWVRSLGWKDPLMESMATHSSILAWRIPINRGAWQTTVHGVTKSRTWLSDWAHTNWNVNMLVYIILDSLPRIT